MQRGLACVLLLLAACSDDGTPTAAATLTGGSASVMSAYSKPFTGADGSGATVLGWKVVLSDAAVGTGCKASGVKSIVTVAIYTSQMADSSHTIADLATGDISVVLPSPPTAPDNGASANMGIDGVSNLQGTVSITGVGKSADGKTTISLNGMINVGGTDANNASVILSGMFEAPVCN